MGRRPTIWSSDKTCATVVERHDNKMGKYNKQNILRWIAVMERGKGVESSGYKSKLMDLKIGYEIRIA